MIKAIVLDVGGVLLRTEDDSSRRDLERKHDLSPGASEKLVFGSEAALASTIGAVGPNVIWQNVADELSLSPEALEDFKRAFWQGDQFDKELIDFLIEMRDDYTTALLTNAWKYARDELAENFDIREGQTVDYILISSELGVAKPDEEIYHILKEKLNCDFEEILFVDDFEENIKAAQELGNNTIHFKPEMDLIKTIKSKLET